MPIEPGAWGSLTGRIKKGEALVLQMCYSGLQFQSYECLSQVYKRANNRYVFRCPGEYLDIRCWFVRRNTAKGPHIDFLRDRTGQKSRALCPVPLAPQRLGLGSLSSVSWL